MKISFKITIQFISLLSVFISCTDRNTVSEIQMIERQGVKIDFTRCGNSDTTILFVHGWAINKSYWEPQVNQFCSRFNVVTIDLPGHGSSGKNRSDWSVESFADDIKKIIDTLQLKNVVLVGHSMSGNIILQTAVRYPQHIIALVGVDNFNDAGAELTAEQREQSLAALDYFRKDFTNTVEAYAMGSFFQPTTDTNFIKQVVKDLKNNDSVAVTNILEGIFRFSGKEKELLKNCPVKLYLINSDAGKTDEEALTKLAKSSYKIFYVHQSSHFPMLEKPVEFNKQFENVMKEMSTSQK